MQDNKRVQLRVSVVGLGKLGASMAAAIADGGHTVIGYDVEPSMVAALAAGQAPVQESNLQTYVDRNRDRLHARSDLQSVITETDLTFVVVPTPSEPSGAFSLVHAEAAFRAIGEALRHKDTYHLVVLSSTVLPGSTRFRLIPALEEASGKTCGSQFGVCYSPEFIALGSVIHDFLNPDFTLIGEFDERSGAILENAYSVILRNGAPARRMSIENAELSKVALNTFVTTKITFANMLADLCERIPGGDVDVVSDALGLDRRIGRRYLTGGISYGGPCFPRDNQALTYFARMVGATAELAETTDGMNRRFALRIAGRIAPLAQGRPVGLLGLAYKPHTPVLDESPALAIAAALHDAGAILYAHEPALNRAPPELAGRVRLSDSIEELLASVDIVIVTTPDPAFVNLPIQARTRSGPLVVMDCWRIAEATLRGRDGVEYYAVGRGTEDFNAERLRALWRGEPAPRPVSARAR